VSSDRRLEHAVGLSRTVSSRYASVSGRRSRSLSAPAARGALARTPEEEEESVLIRRKRRELEAERKCGGGSGDGVSRRLVYSDERGQSEPPPAPAAGRSVGKVSGGAAISIFYRGAAGGLVPCRAPTSRRERGTDCALPPQRMHPASSTTATSSSSSSSQQPPQLHASAAVLTAPFRGPLGAARSDGAASHPSKLIVSPQ